MALFTLLRFCCACGCCGCVDGGRRTVAEFSVVFTPVASGVVLRYPGGGGAAPAAARLWADDARLAYELGCSTEPLLLLVGTFCGGGGGAEAASTVPVADPRWTGGRGGGKAGRG
jgi:hypothetical protein